MAKNFFADKFYHSSAWKRTAQQYREDHFYICERCGKPGARNVHHKKHLAPDNVGNPNVALNPDNFELLCNECHNEEHDRFQSTSTRDILYDRDGNVVGATDRHPPHR